MNQPTMESPEQSTAAEAISLPLDTSLPTDGDLRWVIDALDSQRDELLERWLDAVSAQPFHAGRRERAVADDIPRLFDALLSFLRDGAEPWRDPGAPLDDPGVLAAAGAHARARAAQGLLASDVAVEFRLLRREIWRGLHEQLVDNAPITDVISAELLINDALDGAIAMGLAELSARVEEVREDFLVTTIHEVRQPITAIKGTAQFAERALARDEPDLSRVSEALSQVRAQADRMASLLDTLVDTSRAMLGQIQLSYEQSDLRDLVTSAIEQLGPDAAKRINLDLPTDGASIGQWDGPRLRHVISNLLSNAIKYSPSGTPVDVVVRAVASGVELTVRDRGIGIEPDELDNLFRRYSRGQSVVEQGIEGLGLGLYLCKQIVDAHGGRIWAESDGAGKGTTMHVVLPRERVAAQDD